MNFPEPGVVTGLNNVELSQCCGAHYVDNLLGGLSNTRGLLFSANPLSVPEDQLADPYRTHTYVQIPVGDSVLYVIETRRKQA